MPECEYGREVKNLAKSKPEKPEKKPSGQSKNVGVRFTPAEVEALEAIAAKEYRSISGLVRLAVAEFCKSKGFAEWPAPTKPC